MFELVSVFLLFELVLLVFESVFDLLCFCRVDVGVVRVGVVFVAFYYSVALTRDYFNLLKTTLRSSLQLVNCKICLWLQLFAFGAHGGSDGDC